MEDFREYIAFISYRHCPLDIRIAETLHRMIERYRVPRELRKDGEKSLGTVFRDRDELPLSNNLTQDIYDALDHSQFLIVVCTPDTPKSQWVEREIEYFISKHGRDRVLTVLAAGTPEESIPRRITHDYAEDGSVIAEYEPLCAYLVDPSEKNILKNLKKEFLRLIAAMLNCPYDALRQRQKRYRMQQLTALMGVVTAIALVFTLMLGNRNREISNKNQEISQKNEEIASQLLQTQINETNALVLLSQQQLAAGDRIGAIESALNALPHDNDGRPYSPDAEYALSQALNPYGNGKPAFHLTIEQPTDIHMMDVSDDGKYLVTLDVVGCIRCFDVDTAKMLWQYQLVDPDETVYNAKSDAILLEIAEDQNRVVYSDAYNSYLLSLVSGELVHQLPFLGQTTDNKATLSPDGQWLVQSSRPHNFQIGLECACGDNYHIFPLYEIYSVETGERIQRVWSTLEKEWYLDDPVFNEDGTKMAYVTYCMEDPQIWVSVFNMETPTFEYEYFADPNLTDCLYEDEEIGIQWLPDGGLILYYAEQEPGNIDNHQISLHKLDKNGNLIVHKEHQIEGNPYKKTACLTDDYLYIIDSSDVVGIKLDNCELSSQHEAPDRILSYYVDRVNLITAILMDGTIEHINSISSHYLSLNKRLLLALGKHKDIEIQCLVPEESPNTVIIIREQQCSSALNSPTSDVIPDFEQHSIFRFYAFPNKNRFLTLSYSYKHEGEEVRLVVVYDATEKSVIDYFEVPKDDELIGYCQDETVLFFDTCTYNLETNTLVKKNDLVDYPTDGHYDKFKSDFSFAHTLGENPVSGFLKIPENTLYWWTHDYQLHQVILPYDNEIDTVWSIDGEFANEGIYVGRNGLIVVPVVNPSTVSWICEDHPDEYFIYSTDDALYHQVPNQSNTSGHPAFAIGNIYKRVAFADYDMHLRVYDFDQNTVIHQWDLPVSPGTILKMIYSADDRYLFLFVDRGHTTILTVLDTADGTAVGNIDLNLSFYQSRFDRQCIEEDLDNNLLLIYSHSRDESGLVVDMNTWTILAEVPGLQCYIPGANTFVQSKYRSYSSSAVDTNQNLAVTPLYSWEELAEMGWELVNTVKENKLD